MKVTANFSFEEFENSPTAKGLGISNAIRSDRVRAALTALCTDVLQPLRDAWGKPMKVNSGYRCPALNRAVGGTASSQHLKGEAADIACDTPVALAQLARDLGLPYDQMILYPTFVHFSHKLEGEQRRAILYNRRYKGPKVRTA